MDSASSWRANRRPEILELFREGVYGRSPEAPARTLFSLASVDDASLNGLATRKEVDIGLTGTTAGPVMKLLLYIPNASEKLKGSSTHLPWIEFLRQSYNPQRPRHFSRSGLDSKRLLDGWPARRDVAWYSVFELASGNDSPSWLWPRDRTLWRYWSGSRRWTGHGNSRVVPGEQVCFSVHLIPGGLSQGWAWGLSRAMDYLVQDPDVASDKVAVLGHSRLGKAALWAGAQDERFAMVISNNSGCGGAALSRRRFGETVAEINESFPHWFCENFRRFSGA